MLDANAPLLRETNITYESIKVVIFKAINSLVVWAIYIFLFSTMLRRIFLH